MTLAQPLLMVFLLITLSACVTNVSDGPSTGSGAEIARANINLAAEYYRLGRIEYALESAKKALKADSTSVEANSLIASIYSQFGEPKLAQQFFEAAVEYAKFDAVIYGQVHNNFGIFLCSNDRSFDAEAQFLLAAKNKLYRTPEAAYENAALCVLNRPDVQKAKKYFTAALAINPNMPKSLFQMALLSFNEKKHKKTVFFVGKLNSVGVISPEVLMLGLQSQLALGETKKARVFFEQLKREFPNATEAGLSWESMLSHQ